MASIPAKRQLRLMRAIEKAHAPKIAGEVARASMAYLRQWREAGAIGQDLEHQRRIGEILDGMARIAVRMFATETTRAIRRAEKKDFADTLAKLAFRYISQEAYRRRIVGIADTTRNQIIDAVARGFADGLAQDGVADYVLDLVPQFSRQRAEIIARTEVHGAANYGALGAAKETGIELRKEWLAAEDERTRPDHEAANGQIVDMDGMFDVGGYAMAYPGDPSGPASQVISCRCTLAYIPVD
jgi:SPP1 gp7 family putative phage head morphogenesis protein